jgi:DNA-binding NarL/FixJ family response regulator
MRAAKAGGSGMIRVLLADDHVLVRAGVRALLEGMAGIEVVAETGDGAETRELIARHRPAVVLMDISMPGLNGLEAAARITNEFPRVRVIVFSMHGTRQHVLEAMRTGAAGYLVKESRPEDLEAAIRTVARGEIYLGPRIAGYVVDDVRSESVPPSELERLTSRQREILQLIAEGQNTKQIAGRLAIGMRTVETHRAELMARLDIHDVAGLVRFAIATGLISLEP